MLKKCAICKKKFYVSCQWTYNKRRTCSLKCGKKFKGLLYTGKGNPFYGKNHSKKCKEIMRKLKLGKYLREKSGQWKGGRRLSSDGYILVMNRSHPFCDKHGYVREHRLVMEKHLGRYLKPFERVHHLKKIKTDNRIENLKYFPNESKHQQFHGNPQCS